MASPRGLFLALGVMAHFARESRGQAFCDAFASPDPLAALSELARSLVKHGVAQSELLAAFQEQLDMQASAGDETLYNALADVMDRIVGWCSPEASLFESGTRPGGNA